MIAFAMLWFTKSCTILLDYPVLQSLNPGNFEDCLLSISVLDNAAGLTQEFGTQRVKIYDWHS